MRREPGIRPENLLQLALDEIDRLKRTKTRTTDGRNLVLTPPGSAPGGGSGNTIPAPPEGAPHVLFGSKNTNSLHVTASTGLDVAFESSQVWIGGVFYTVAGGTLTLADDATNYVFVDNTGVVTSNTTGFPTESLPLAVVTTASGAITNVADRRAYLSDQGLAQAHTLFGATHTESLRVTDGGTDDLAFDDGNTTIGGTDRGEGDANESNATKVTLTGGVYTTISFYGNVSPTGTRHVNVGIYDDSAGAPGTLQATTGYVVIAGSASPSWNTIALTAPATLPSGTYHIAVLGDGGFSVVTHWYYDTGSSGDSHEDNPDTVSDGLEATWSGGSSGDKVLSAYISGTNTVPVVDYEAGQIWIGSTFYSIVAGSIDIEPDTLNYVFVDNTGAVTSNTTGFPSDCAPLAEVTAVDENITLIEDRRSYLLQFGSAYSDEQAQDAVGTILVDSSEVNFTYTDATPSITAALIDNTIVVARMHAAASPRLFGRSTAAAGAGEEITVGSGLDLSGGVLTATGGSPHDLLDGDVDQDTVAHVVVEGDIIFGNATPAWDALSIGTEGQVLTVISGLPSWEDASGGYTNEQAQDAVGTILLDTATINLSYDDGTPTISADVIQSALDHGSIGGLADNDHPQYLLLSIFTADGDIAYRDVDDVVKALPIGGANKVLTVTSGLPSWEDPTGGGGSPAIPVWHRNFMMMGA